MALIATMVGDSSAGTSSNPSSPYGAPAVAATTSTTANKNTTNGTFARMKPRLTGSANAITAVAA